MSDYVKTAAKYGDQYLDAVAERQEMFLKFIGSFTPWMKMPYKVPAGVPSISEWFDASFRFSESLLRQQKAFTEKLMAFAMPKPKSAGSKKVTKKKATKVTAKPATKKAPAAAKG